MNLKTSLKIDCYFDYFSTFELLTNDKNYAWGKYTEFTLFMSTKYFTGHGPLFFVNNS